MGLDLTSLKAAARRSFPRLYCRLWRLKDARALSNPERWRRANFDVDDDGEPNPCAVALARWQCRTDRLRYQAATVQDFAKAIDNAPTDLSRVATFALLVLCYVSARDQRRLLRALLANGCRNIVIQDFPADDPDCGRRATNRCFHLREGDFPYRLRLNKVPQARTWAMLDAALPADLLERG